MLIQTKKQSWLTAFLLIFLFTVSCKKNIDSTTPAADTPDFTTKINSSVSGFVTDENNMPLSGATAKCGSYSVTTDQYGYFEIKNVEVVKAAAFVTVIKAGYFNGTKTWAATANKSSFFRIKLAPKTIGGTFSSSSGGIISIAGGLTVAFPVNAVVNATSNSAYSGNVHVAVSWLNPEAEDLTQVMPGDLRGIDEAGSMKGLTTFGMAAVELTGDGGELLQISAGKKATITMPLSSQLLSTAPATIPLWYFDESNGLWKQDGIATKTGNTYTGDVSHFSWWNCDLPNAIVPLTFTIVNANGTPIANAYVEITPADPNTWLYHISGWTDATGFVHASVAPNMSYLLNVFSNCSSGSATFSQQFSVVTTAVDLGNVLVTSANIANVSGTITDCNGNLVTNGAVILLSGYNYTRYATDNTGAFNFSTSLCSSSMNVELVAEDNNSSTQSAPTAYTLAAGTNAIGNLQACGGSIQEFIHYNINGVDYFYNAPGDTITSFFDDANHLVFVSANAPIPGAFGDATFVFSPDGMALNDSVELAGVFLIQMGPTQNVTIIGWDSVLLTEFGAIGDYMSGNFDFSYTVAGDPTLYVVSCNFRARRPI